MNDYAFDNITLARHGTARSLTDTAKYRLSHLLKSLYVLFGNPLCQSCNRLMFRDRSVSVC